MALFEQKRDLTIETKVELITNRTSVRRNEDEIGAEVGDPKRKIR
jgi:hypothetical protein